MIFVSVYYAVYSILYVVPGFLESVKRLSREKCDERHLVRVQITDMFRTEQEIKVTG